ncbi:MAG: DNA mismatch repair endonuclease MutL [Bdellovibrionales bacterium]
MRIKRLSPDVVDQIAAGEVLERPANMVKELLENSLDAGCTDLEIQIEDGGRFVSVSDNGSGIDPEDMKLSLERHATSKIDAAADLWGLNTYGFRGEALSSISAVSKLTIISKKKGAYKAFRMNCEFGKVEEPYETSRESGTTIEVTELFGNVPARLKFLKSDTAETTAIKKVVKAMAMSFPEVGFRLKSRGKLFYQWTKSDSKTVRVSQVFEKKKMYEGEAEIGLTQCKVVFTPPNDVQRNSQNIWFFVQNRWVLDRSLTAAVMAGFENTLMHGEYPSCAVWIECDPQDVDVNIHPTKSQVKFRDPRTAFRVVREAIRTAVAKAPWLEDLLPKENFDQIQFTQNSHEAPTPALASPNNLEFVDNSFDSIQFKSKSDVNDIVAEQRDKVSEILQGYSRRALSRELRIDHRGNSIVETKTNLVTPEMEIKKTVSSDPLAANHHWSNLQVLGQAGLTYIVCQSQNSMVLVDQHAAHERVAFERIMGAWRGGEIEIQQTLLPLTIDMDEESVESLIECSDELTRMGIYLERTGPEQLGVTSYPSILKEKALKTALEKLSDQIKKHGGGTALEHKIGDIAATMACHSVVRAGQALSIEEMKSLLVQMDEYPLSSFCPHGRPVFVEYPFSKIDKDFGRIV